MCESFPTGRGRVLCNAESCGMRPFAESHFDQNALISIRSCVPIGGPQLARRVCKERGHQKEQHHTPYRLLSMHSAQSTPYVRNSVVCICTREIEEMCAEVRTVPLQPIDTDRGTKRACVRNTEHTPAINKRVQHEAMRVEGTWKGPIAYVWGKVLRTRC